MLAMYVALVKFELFCGFRNGQFLLPCCCHMHEVLVSVEPFNSIMDGQLLLIY